MSFFKGEVWKEMKRAFWTLLIVFASWFASTSFTSTAEQNIKDIKETREELRLAVKRIEAMERLWERQGEINDGLKKNVDILTQLHFKK